MNMRSKIVALALCGFGLLGLTSLSASAAIVCNNEGACWHVKRQFAYPPTARIIIHPDTWRWGPGEHFVWKEHEGPGYWRGGTWVTP
jgi:hypothetical protein